jgi:hypothetical protein
MEQQQQQADRRQQSQHGDRRQGQEEVVEISNRRGDGTFKSKEEMDAERAAGAVQQQGGEGGEPKMVPHAALHAERLRFAEVYAVASMAEARMNALVDASSRGKPAAPESPSLEENPAEYILALERRLEEFAQGRQEEQETRQIDTALTNDEDLFKLSVQDYEEASESLRSKPGARASSVPHAAGCSAH